MDRRFVYQSESEKAPIMFTSLLADIDNHIMNEIFHSYNKISQNHKLPTNSNLNIWQYFWQFEFCPLRKYMDMYVLDSKTHVWDKRKR